MTAYDFFSQYWWLIFVLFWPLMGIVGAITHYNHRREMLRMLKSYADQGKDPPAALLDAMKTEDRDDYEGPGYYGRRRWRRHRRGSGWTSAIVFAALSAGFGYAGYTGNLGEAGTIFTALAIGFGVGAVAMLIRAIIESLNPPRLDSRDDEPK